MPLTRYTETAQCTARQHHSHGRTPNLRHCSFRLSPTSSSEAPIAVKHAAAIAGLEGVRAGVGLTREAPTGVSYAHARPGKHTGTS